MPFILIVDDEPGVRGVLRLALDRAGYATAEAVCGRDALDQMAAGLRPNLILLDLVMPGVTGSAMLDELRSNGDRTPVILMTGYMHRVRADLRRHERLLGVIPKPMDLTELVAEVDQALRPNGSGHEVPAFQG